VAFSMEEYLHRYPPPARSKDEEIQPVHPGKGDATSPAGIPVGATLDLHGLTVEEGRHALDQFIRNAVRRNLRKVLVIHGKGKSVGTMSPMKRMVRDYLETNPTVGAMGVPDTRDGGHGATWAIIRQRSR
jgi:DNA-nicking Smr family endonuclease